MIHFDKTVTRKRLVGIKPVDPPGAGRNWKPVPFKEALACFDHELTAAGLPTLGMEKRYALSPNQKSMAVVCNVDGGPKLPKHVTLQYGMMTGNDRHTPLTIYQGIEVKDPSIGVYSAVLQEIRAPGRNTIKVNTRDRMKTAVVTASSYLEEFPEVVKLYLLNQSRTEYDALESMVRIAEQRLVPWSYLKAGNAVRRQIKTYHWTPGEITKCLWECLRGTNPIHHLRAGMAFNSILFA